MRRPALFALSGAATAAAAVLLGTIGVATAQNAPTGTVASTCDNPVLNHNLNGWGRITGTNPFRYPVTGTLADTNSQHATATGAYVQIDNPPNPRAWLPQQPIKPGTKRTFSVDYRTDKTGQGRILVDWYNATGGYLGQDAGPWTALDGTPTAWRPVAGDFTAPAGAARANVLADSQLPAGADFSLTACSYLPTTDPDPEPTDPPPTSEEPPPSSEEPPPSSEEPPPGDSTEAAVKFNWGAPLPSSDEFNYTGAPNPSKWGVYNGPGHDGNGTRDPNRVTVDGSKLVMTGLANGASAGMASQFDQQYGRWEARVRSVSANPGAGRQYHPLLIIWPQSNQWPDHGEYDFLENGAPGEQCAEAFLHYPGHTPIRQEHAVETNCGAPLSEWHNVALEWDAGSLTGYIDGQEWFDFGEHDITAMPSGHLTIQLDNFFGGNMTPATYEVDWVRIYAP